MIRVVVGMFIFGGKRKKESKNIYGKAKKKALEKAQL